MANYYVKWAGKRKRLLYKTVRQEGFTLIEVLVATLILSIIIAAFVPLFTTSYSGVFSAGHKSKGQYKAQEAMENVIAGNSNTISDVTITKTQLTGFTISFGGTDIKVNGNKVDVNFDNGKEKAALTSFIPD